MSVVVERGLARCPRCVAVADYTFVESGPNSLRYEVHCGRCGEAYCEVHLPLAPGLPAAGGALVVRPPDPEARAVHASLQRVLARLADAGERAWIALKGRAFRQ